MLFLTEKRRRKRSNNHRERNKQKRILHPTAPLRAPTKWQSLQADEQLRSAQVAGQWRGDTALTLPLFWRRSAVSPVFFGRFPRSSQSPCPLPTLSPSLIGHPASVDVKQHKSQKLMKLALPGRTWKTPRGMHCLQTTGPAVHYLPYQRIHARFPILTPAWILNDELKLTTRRLMMLTLTAFITNNYKWVKISFPHNLARGITLRTQVGSWKEPSVTKLRRTLAT